MRRADEGSMMSAMRLYVPDNTVTSGVETRLAPGVFVYRGVPGSPLPVRAVGEARPAGLCEIDT